MPIVSISAQWKGRGGSTSAQGETEEQVYLVVMGSGLRTSTEVKIDLKALGIYMGSTHPFNPFLICSKVDPKNTNAPRIWKVTVSYSTLSLDRKDSADPNLDPIQISVEEEKFTRPALRNRDGEAILTSSGTMPDPPVMVEDTNRIYNIEGSSAGIPFPAWEAAGFRNAINIDEFTLAGTDRVVTAKHAKVRSITIGKVEFRSGEIPYRSFKIQLEVLDPGEPDWEERTKFLDASYERTPEPVEIWAGTYAETDRVQIKLPDGTQPRRPVLLNGNGQPLTDPSPANAVFLESKTLRLAVFTGNLPGCA